MARANAPDDKIHLIDFLRGLVTRGDSEGGRFVQIPRALAYGLNAPLATLSLIGRKQSGASVGLSDENLIHADAFNALITSRPDALIVADTLKNEALAHHPLVTAPPRVRSLIGYPVFVDGRIAGAICAMDTQPRDFSENDVTLVAELARLTQMSLSEQTHQNSSTSKLLKQTVVAISDTMALRDSYTVEHEARSMEIAVEIGRELGWDDERLEGVRLGAAIHDIGKLSIPMEVLTKPKRLTPAERLLIEQHPGAGFALVKDMVWPWPIADIVHQHHERLDGTGYPNNLKGHEIIPEAQVVSIADIVESMAIDRPYRTGLGLDRALSEIERQIDTKLDREIVRTCLRICQRPGYRLPTTNKLSLTLNL